MLLRLRYYNYAGDLEFTRTVGLTLWRLQGDTVSVSYTYPDYQYDVIIGDEIDLLSNQASLAISPSERWIAFSSGALVVVRNPLYTPYGDIDNSGCVDDGDLLTVLSAFGSTNAAADLDGNGVVDDGDLLIVLFNFGQGC